jgi:hypothetical protein
MIPSDYRLDEVSARLVERMEAFRGSYQGNEVGLAAEAERVCKEHLRRLAAEQRELGLLDEPGHLDFLRRSLFEVFLPRWLRLAEAVNRREANGFGLPALREPAVRLVVGAVVLVILVPLLRLALTPTGLVLIVALGSVPLWPELLAAITRRGHQRDLAEMLQDLRRLQEEERRLLPPAGRGAGR